MTLKAMLSKLKTILGIKDKKPNIKVPDCVLYVSPASFERAKGKVMYVVLSSKGGEVVEIPITLAVDTYVRGGKGYLMVNGEYAGTIDLESSEPKAEIAEPKAIQ